MRSQLEVFWKSLKVNQHRSHPWINWLESICWLFFESHFWANSGVDAYLKNSFETLELVLYVWRHNTSYSKSNQPCRTDVTTTSVVTICQEHWGIILFLSHSDIANFNPKKGGGVSKWHIRFSETCPFVAYEVMPVKPPCKFHFWCLEQLENII